MPRHKPLTINAGRNRPTATSLPLAGICLLPVLASATPFDGTYRQSANADCSLVGVDGGSLKIADDTFYGVGMECDMTEPVNVLDMDAELYTMQCSGEDEAWTERAMLMNSAEGDGIIMVWNGYAFRYDRCPDPDDLPVASIAE